MIFNIDLQRYKSTFEVKKDQFQHSSGKLIHLFPYAVTRTYLPASNNDLRKFKGIAGSFCRACLSLQESESISKDKLIALMLEEVDGEKKENLENIISGILFDENAHLILFNHQVLPYLNLDNPNPQLIALQKFIIQLLLDDEVIEMLKKTMDKEENNNVLYQLLLDQLKKMVKKTQEKVLSEGYYQGEIAQNIRSLFKEDLSNLIKSPALFSAKISDLIKFYYFIYIVRLSGELNKMFDQSVGIPPLYFSLEWEKLSKSRLAIDNGWKRLEHLVEPIFAHSNCIEMLNTMNLSKKEGLQKCLIYADLMLIVQKGTEDDEKDLIKTVTNLLRGYKEKFPKIDWDNFEKKYSYQQGDLYIKYYSFSLIEQLFAAIKYQFENSDTTYNAYQTYSKWFSEFVRINYYKTRGSLGGTLKIDKETLLLFTELSIMSSGKDKILTSNLWMELEKRDILLDTQSKKEVVLFFEKINILEKKSDSGDAQFVTRLHK